MRSIISLASSSLGAGWHSPGLFGQGRTWIAPRALEGSGSAARISPRAAGREPSTHPAIRCQHESDQILSSHWTQTLDPRQMQGPQAPLWATHEKDEFGQGRISTQPRDEELEGGLRRPCACMSNMSDMCFSDARDPRISFHSDGEWNGICVYVTGLKVMLDMLDMHARGRAGQSP
jgi:hypothetical protein